MRVIAKGAKTSSAKNALRSGAQRLMKARNREREDAKEVREYAKA
jgi:hypothetical protein